MIGGVVKEEKVKQVKALNIKEVWKTRTETLAKIVINQDNLDHRDKPYHLEQMNAAANGVPRTLSRVRRRMRSSLRTRSLRRTLVLSARFALSQRPQIMSYLHITDPTSTLS